MFRTAIRQASVFSPLMRAGFKTTTAETKSKSLGSYHWNFERALSVVTPALMGAAVFGGQNTLVDIGLGIVLPLHCHIGFDAMITDYFPERKYKALNFITTWALRLVTAITLFGCFIINSKDVGLTNLTKKLWTGKL
ncbi:membrane anchor subunit of succinate dehydrogenase, Sdh4 [Boothiomyces macroporosus]|uniref:Succinate dehydrogenase [ubiquinone] cytochrome b small subunit n=1 Tax=Boothiomyces macroporosus TaxID=261099 RepID=A0AAD5UMG0_9FUNG|nr:membrane anchor subunit of succinate dehydrogenase, Sdh4 [Boothiomyces macroporosus]